MGATRQVNSGRGVLRADSCGPAVERAGVHVGVMTAKEGGVVLDYSSQGQRLTALLFQPGDGILVEMVRVF